jgi:hypothetical protein
VARRIESGKHPGQITDALGSEKGSYSLNVCAHAKGVLGMARSIGHPAWVNVAIDQIIASGRSIEITGQTEVREINGFHSSIPECAFDDDASSNCWIKQFMKEFGDQIQNRWQRQTLTNGRRF